MSARFWTVAVLLVLFLPVTASARGRHHRAAWGAYSYPPSTSWASFVMLVRPSPYALPAASVPICGPFYPAPACAPVVSVPPCLPGPVIIPRGTPYAIPRPAPPSDTPVVPERVRPRPRKPPRVTESRYPSSDEASRRRTSSRKPPRDRCRVGFWNVSNRDLTLKVNGRARRLLHGSSVTLRLRRHFVWQISGSTPHEEAVPAEKSTMEIVIRR